MKRRSPLLQGGLRRPAEPDWLPIVRGRVERLGGRLVGREGDRLRVEGVGPDPGLDLPWIRAACEVPLFIPVEPVRDALREDRAGGEGWTPRLDRLLDQRIRFHQGEVKAELQRLVASEGPRVRVTEDAVRQAEGQRPEPRDLRAEAQRTWVGWLQQRDAERIAQARGRLEALELSGEAREAVERAMREAVQGGFPPPDAPALAGLEELGAWRVAVVRRALEALEVLEGQRPSPAHAEAVETLLLPLVDLVDDADLDALL